MSWSLRRRLAVTVVATTTLVLVAMAAALYVGVRRAAWRQHDRALLSRAHAIAASAEHEEGDYEVALPRQPAGEPLAYIEVWRPDGSVLARSGELGARDLPRAAVPAAGYAFEDVELPDHRAGRAVALTFAAREETVADPPRLTVVLAEGTEAVDEAVANVRLVFLIVGVLAIAAIAGATLLVLARGLRPVSRLAAAIDGIDDRQLATRIALDGQPRELAVAVRKLNELLARLEASFARERELTGDVSHELRTPLAALRTLLEVTALEERSTADYRAALADALGLVKQLTALVENLLALARLDAGQVAVSESDVDLRELVDECWAEQRAIAAARDVTFRNEVAAGTIVRTDRDKLRVVVGNLLANAAEYTERGGWIAASTGDDVLRVTDSGPRLGDAQLARVFDRFWRGDHARAGDGAHCGIGLALSRSLCTRLALSLDAESSERGVAFRVRRA